MANFDSFGAAILSRDWVMVIVEAKCSCAAPIARQVAFTRVSGAAQADNYRFNIFWFPIGMFQPTIRTQPFEYRRNGLYRVEAEHSVN